VPGLEAIGISLVGLGYNVSIGDQAGASAGPGVTARTGVPNVAFAAKASGELGVGHVTLGYFKVPASRRSSAASGRPTRRRMPTARTFR
jgi:hypothetical protein